VNKLQKHSKNESGSRDFQRDFASPFLTHRAGESIRQSLVCLLVAMLLIWAFAGEQEQQNALHCTQIFACALTLSVSARCGSSAAC
jgi:hypothetical protein